MLLDFKAGKLQPYRDSMDAGITQMRHTHGGESLAATTTADRSKLFSSGRQYRPPAAGAGMRYRFHC